MKKILVVGGAGFIGSTLTRKLKEQNNEVVIIDNLITGKKENIDKDIIFIEKDIVNITINTKFDEIYHLGSLASPIFYQQYPLETIKVNTIGSINLLEYAKENNSRILFTSTSEIYGNPIIHPQTEEDWGNVNPFGPRSCYDEAKRCGEAIFYTFKEKYNVAIRIARIFNTYGPYMFKNDGRVVSNFIINAVNNKPLKIYGTGNQTRSFCYVDDTVDCLIKLMNSDYSRPINIGNPTEITIKQLANEVINITKSNSTIKYIDGLIDDPNRRKPDISLAEKELNWRPKYNLKEGLEKTIEYFKNKGDF